ncbi:MAG: DNA adenine methylase, partial [Phocaeicola sp.]|nr:DNA adenine methylase [Phocaeicola sp.]
MITAMKKYHYSQAPLPFVGQKRMFASEFRKVLKRFSDRTVFVDLFGGSGLLSHITKRERPDATVIYNDHDNYRERLENISRTNALLSDLRRLSEGIPRHRMLSKKMHGMFLERIRREESTGFVDYLTISSSLLFSGKYARNIGELGKLNFYNNMRLSDYCCEGYLDGLEVVCCDYR